MFEKGYTHGGAFHMDEMGCIALLKTINPEFTYERQEFRGAEIPAEYYEKNAIIFDVGGGEFDHHDANAQKEHDSGVKYAACGKVYDAIRDEFQKATGLSDRGMLEVDRFVENIDAADNAQFLDNDPDMGRNDMALAVKSFFDPKHPENFEKGLDLVSESLNSIVKKELLYDKGLKPQVIDSDATINNFLENLSEMDERFKNYQISNDPIDEIYVETMTQTLNSLNPEYSVLKNDLLQYKTEEECNKILSDIVYTGSLTKAEKNMNDYNRISNLDMNNVVNGVAILNSHLTTQEPHIKELLNEKNIKFIVYPAVGGQYNFQPVDKNELTFPESWAGYTGKEKNPDIPEEISFVHVARFIGSIKPPSPDLSDSDKDKYIRNTVEKISNKIMEIEGYNLKENELDQDQNIDDISKKDDISID